MTRLLVALALALVAACGPDVAGFGETCRAECDWHCRTYCVPGEPCDRRCICFDMRDPEAPVVVLDMLCPAWPHG